MKSKDDSVCVPSLHLGEIHSHQSVGHGLLIQVATVSPDEGWHVITWWSKKKQTVRGKEISSVWVINNILTLLLTFKHFLLNYQKYYGVQSDVPRGKSTPIWFSERKLCCEWSSQGFVCALPCRAPLSRKLFRLNRVFLEARYWMKRCNKKNKS